jgi:hypothetical protein
MGIKQEEVFMNWISFTLTLLVVLIVYYTLVILYDVFIKKMPAQVVGDDEEEFSFFGDTEGSFQPIYVPEEEGEGNFSAFEKTRRWCKSTRFDGRGCLQSL